MPPLRGAAMASSLAAALHVRGGEQPAPLSSEVPARVRSHLLEMRSRLAQLQDLMSSLEAEYATQHQHFEEGGEQHHGASNEEAGGACGPSPTMSYASKSEILFEAVSGGKEADALAMIRDGRCSPNTVFRDFQIRGKPYVSGHPLAVAVLSGRVGLVEPLVALRADPNQAYSFRAGGEQILWSGPPIHAAVPGGNMEMIRELVRAGADLHGRSSNGANLMWQAAYFGQGGVLGFLLEAHVDFGVKAMSQDDSSRSYSPLHAAAKAGHVASVSALLGAKADLHVDDGWGRRPLDDAAAQGHAEVVRQLVAANADLFRSVDGRGPRSLDLILRSENSHLVAAAAAGLARAPKLLDKLCKEDFIRFLGAEGEAPLSVLNAVFQPHAVRYWAQGLDGKLLRMLRTVAFVDGREGVNIVLGPHCRVLEKHFFDKAPPRKELQAFLSDLVPWEKGGQPMMYVPVTTYMCHIPFLHQELEVLLALADCADDRVFGVKGCQAIVNLKWQAERLGSRARLVLALVEVFNLLLLNIILGGVYTDQTGSVLRFANILALVVWLISLFWEVCQAVGYCANGLHLRYAASARYWFDWTVSVCTGVVIFWTFSLSSKADAALAYNTLLGVLVFLKWMRLLISLRQVKPIGLRILPITTTMFDVGPFIGVLSVFIMGSVNMYYALGIYPELFECFMLIYRLVVLGDVDLFELENVFNPSMTIENSAIVQAVPAKTQYYLVVRVMMVALSFIIGLAMMNIFVAMLCLSYSMAAENAWFAFMRSRAGIVLDMHAGRLGLRSLLSLLLCRCRRQAGARDLRRTGTSLDDASEQAQKAFIWYAHHEHQGGAGPAPH